MTIRKGDDTNAFGKNFIKINFNNPKGYVITRAEFRVGCLMKVFDNPEFPLYVNYDKEESKHLEYNNVGYLRVYDENGLRETCKSFLKFKADEEVV